MNVPNVRIEMLPGQADEGMTTAPEMYAEAISKFLLGSDDLLHDAATAQAVTISSPT